MPADSQRDDDGLEFSGFDLADSPAGRAAVSPAHSYKPISSIVSLDSLEIAFEPDEGDHDDAPRRRSPLFVEDEEAPEPERPGAPAEQPQQSESGLADGRAPRARDRAAPGDPAGVRFATEPGADELPGGFESWSGDTDGLIGIETGGSLPDPENPRASARRRSGGRAEPEDGWTGGQGADDFGGLLADLTQEEAEGEADGSADGARRRRGRRSDDGGDAEEMNGETVDDPGLPQLADLLGSDEDILGALPSPELPPAAGKKRSAARPSTSEEDEADGDDASQTFGGDDEDDNEDAAADDEFGGGNSLVARGRRGKGGAAEEEDSTRSSRRRRRKSSDLPPRERPGYKRSEDERPDRVPLKLRGRLTEDRYAPRDGKMRHAPEDPNGLTEEEAERGDEPEDLELLSGRRKSGGDAAGGDDEAGEIGGAALAEGDLGDLLGEFGAGEDESFAGGSAAADEAQGYDGGAAADSDATADAADDAGDFGDGDADGETIPAPDALGDAAFAQEGFGDFLNKDLDLASEFGGLDADADAATSSGSAAADSGLAEEDREFAGSFNGSLDLGRLGEEEEESFSGSGRLYDDDEDAGAAAAAKRRLPPAGEAFIRTMQRWQRGMPTREELTQATRDWLDLLHSMRYLLKEQGLAGGTRAWLRNLRSLVGMEHSLNPFRQHTLPPMPGNDKLETTALGGIGSAMPGVSGADDWGDSGAVPAGAATGSLADEAFSGAVDNVADNWGLPGAENAVPANAWGADAGASDLAAEFSSDVDPADLPGADDLPGTEDDGLPGGMDDLPGGAAGGGDPDMPPDDILPDEQDFSFSTADMLMQDSELGLSQMNAEFSPDGAGGGAAAAEEDAAPGAFGWLRRHSTFLRKWGMLLYKYLDHYADFANNWWKMVDFLALVILAMAAASFLSYFLWYSE